MGLAFAWWLVLAGIASRRFGRHQVLLCQDAVDDDDIIDVLASGLVQFVKNRVLIVGPSEVRTLFHADTRRIALLLASRPGTLSFLGLTPKDVMEVPHWSTGL